MRILMTCAVLALLALLPPRQRQVSVLEERHADGRLAVRETRIDGRREGLHETWWPNGQPRSRAAYLHDVYHGDYRTWRQDGTPYERRRYVHGREEGVQQSWDERGRLYLNYEVRQGRRYGLVNAYPCASSTMIVAPAEQGAS